MIEVILMNGHIFYNMCDTNVSLHILLMKLKFSQLSCGTSISFLTVLKNLFTISRWSCVLPMVDLVWSFVDWLYADFCHVRIFERIIVNFQLYYLRVWSVMSKPLNIWPGNSSAVP